MVLRTIYIEDQVFTKYQGYYYLRVFEHNFTTSKCFNSTDEALEVDVPGKFSIISHLNESDYRFKDNKLHFIIEYPNQNIYHSWSQSLPPYDDIKPEGSYEADGFEPNETLAVYAYNATNGKWGGLVRNTILSGNHSNSLLDGIPGDNFWYYTIGMLCNTSSIYLKEGFPDFSGRSTRVRLFARVENMKMKIQFYLSKIRCTMREKLYILPYYIFLYQVFICL